MTATSSRLNRAPECISLDYGLGLTTVSPWTTTDSKVVDSVRDVYKCDLGQGYTFEEAKCVLDYYAKARVLHYPTNTSNQRAVSTGYIHDVPFSLVHEKLLVGGMSPRGVFLASLKMY